MSQIPNIKLNGSTKSLNLNVNHPARPTSSIDGNLSSHSCKNLDDLLGKASFIEKNIPENASSSYNNFGVVTRTFHKELEQYKNRSFADSVVKMHFVNPNYYSNSDASGLTGCDSETSLRSNECDRRYHEIKQWHSNLFFYKRSDATINLNRRVKLRFQPLKPFVMH